MSAANYDLVIDQGSTFVIDLEVKEAGVVKNLTNFSARAKMKSSKSATSASAVFTCTIPTPSNGIIKMELPATTSGALTAGQYFYDLEIHTSDNSIVKRLIEGVVNINGGITVGVT
jgi:hypothetical protein